ncbi:hypothetical protein VNO77_43666 [Canavalia gladiata]|uniref:Uncharacterized protein n=1 Tax=Canavalia gladiata TaxID=3824 RepID=A0AAN9JWL7_CANGL
MCPYHNLTKQVMVFISELQISCVKRHKASPRLQELILSIKKRVILAAVVMITGFKVESLTWLRVAAFHVHCNHNQSGPFWYACIKRSSGLTTQRLEKLVIKIDPESMLQGM